MPDPLPALEVENYGQFEPAPGVVAERVSYATAYGLRVPAIVYRPKQLPAAKMPGIVVVNGHGGDKFSWYSFYTGILYARAGAAVVTYDPIGEGERNLQRKDGSRQHDRTVDPPEMGSRMGGLMITDVMQAVSYLSQRRRYRPQAHRRRGLLDGLLRPWHRVRRGNAREFLRAGGRRQSRWPRRLLGFQQQADVPGDSVSIAPVPGRSRRGALRSACRPRRHAGLNGSADDVVSIPRMGADSSKAFKSARSRCTAARRTSLNSASRKGPGTARTFVTRPVALWLEKHLSFPNWTAESIARMPETHILEWAEKGGVFIDKPYATELREGGTRALGTDIPAVPHDDMNALPLARWNREKDKYVYETWVKNARALLR